jgi:Uncharacterized protein conserved in bacteria (DUF2188)
MHKPRYVVVNQEGRWQIRQAGRHFTSVYSSKAQALVAAIEFAESDGNGGRSAEVLVRSEDDHFITEWAYGKHLHLKDATPVAVTPQYDK